MLTTLKLFMLGLLFLPPSAMHRDPWHHGQIVVRQPGAPILAQSYSPYGQLLGQTPVSGTPTTSWVSGIEGFWSLDESAGATRVNTGNAGTGWNLTDATSTGQDTSDPRQGTAAADFNGSSNQITCTDASCGIDPSNDFTFGTWYKPDVDHGSQVTIMFDVQVFGQGWDLEETPAAGNNDFHCRILEVFSGVGDQIVGALVAGTWSHITCTVDGAATQVVTAFHNGTSSGSPGSGSINCCANTSDPVVGSRGGAQYINGKLDGVFFDFNVTWTASEVARGHSCGVAGELCTCVASSPTEYLSCFTDSDCRECASCSQSALCTNGKCQGRNTPANTLTACNASAPA
jgi:hypothetical protein